jgi:hydrogenase expression/formation protein HypC
MLAEVLAVTGPDAAEVRAGDGGVRTVSLLTLEEEIAPGDWLVVHAGFALSRISADQAGEAASIRGSGRARRPGD